MIDQKWKLISTRNQEPKKKEFHDKIHSWGSTILTKKKNQEKEEKEKNLEVHFSINNRRWYNGDHSKELQNRNWDLGGYIADWFSSLKQAFRLGTEKIKKKLDIKENRKLEPSHFELC